MDTRRVHDGWNRFDVVTIEAADREGKLRRHQREVVDHGDASAVLVLDRRRGVAIMVRQLRAPLLSRGDDPFLLEACAGLVDPGETPEDAARRETREEAGVELTGLRRIVSVLTSAGAMTERIHLFVADVADGARTAGGGNAHEDEDIEIVELPLPELFRRARNGEIEDAKTLILVQQLIIEELEGHPRARIRR